MKGKHVFAFAVAILMLSVIIGMLAVRDTRTPSIEVLNSIAIEESRAAQRRADEAAEFTRAMFMAGFAFAMLIASALTMPVVLSRMARRHDRLPDNAGRFAIMPAHEATHMFNANTHLALGVQVSEQTSIELARLRATVDATAVAFQHGIERTDARARQRHIGEPVPDEWNVTTPEDIEQPAQEAAPEFLLVDDKGERSFEPSESIGRPKIEVNTWP